MIEHVMLMVRSQAFILFLLQQEAEEEPVYSAVPYLLYNEGWVVCIKKILICVTVT